MSQNQSGKTHIGIRDFLLGAVVAGSLAACAHPSAVSYGRTTRGLHGLESEISIVATVNCEVTVTELNQLPRHGTLSKEDCDSLFAIAARAKLVRDPNCPVSEVFSAGVSIKLSNGTALYGCTDQPLASFMTRLYDRIAPTLRSAMPRGCPPFHALKMSSLPRERAG